MTDVVDASHLKGANLENRQALSMNPKNGVPLVLLRRKPHGSHA